MATMSKTIRVTAERDLLDLIEDAAREPFILEHDGERFRLSWADDLFADDDPERARDGLRRFAGSISPAEGERLKELVHRGREEVTRPPDQSRAT